MRQLSKSLTTAEFKILFDTCLAYRAGQPDKQGIADPIQGVTPGPIAPLFDCEVNHPRYSGPHPRPTRGCGNWGQLDPWGKGLGQLIYSGDGGYFGVSFGVVSTPLMGRR